MTDFDRIIYTLLILAAIIGTMLMIVYNPMLLITIPISIAIGIAIGWILAMRYPLD